MKRPTEPKQEDCCNNGCNPCIFDVYEKQLQLYEAFRESGASETGVSVQNAISQLEYTKFYIDNSFDLKNEHKLILFKRNNEQSETTSGEKQVNWSPGDHFLFKFISKDLNCTRAYTPLKINAEQPYEFAILVKRYINGVVSNYLCNLNIGDVTLWRGPYGQYKIIPNKFSRLIMIAQGTGIAPLYSIIKQILNNELDLTRIFLFYCCKNIKAILLRDELYSFRSYWNFQYEVFLSEEPKEPIKYKESILKHRLGLSNLQKLKEFSNSDQFLLCGSNMFMEHFKQLLLDRTIKEELIVIF